MLALLLLSFGKTLFPHTEFLLHFPYLVAIGDYFEFVVLHDTIWTLWCIECRVVLVLLWGRKTAAGDRSDDVCSSRFHFCLIQDPCGVWLRWRPLVGVYPIG